MESENSVVTQSGENEMDSEEEIRESLRLDRTYTKVKYESEGTCLYEGNSSDFALESNNSSATYSSYDETYYSNIEIKEEQWWEETESTEVKPESQELIDTETKLPIELKACVTYEHVSSCPLNTLETDGKCTEEVASIENIASFSSRSNQELLQVDRNKLLLNKRGKYRQVGAVKMVPDCECKRHCFDRIKDIERKRIIEHFQKLGSSNLQNAYLFNCLKLDVLNHKKKEAYLPSEHSSSVQYFVQTTEGEKVSVCKTAFLSIHGLQNNTNLIDNIAILKKASLRSSFQNFTTLSQKDLTCCSSLQNAAHMRNSILLRKQFLKVSRPLTWKKRRVLAMLLLHRLRLQLLNLGGTQV